MTKSYFTLDKLFGLVILLVMVLTGLFFYLYFIIPEIFHADGTTFIYIIILLCMIYWLRNMSDNRAENAIRLAATYMLLSAYIVRILALTVWPYDFGRGDGQGLALRIPNTAELNRSIGFAILYIGAFISGLFLQRLFPVRDAKINSQSAGMAAYRQARHELVFQNLFSWRKEIGIALFAATLFQTMLGFILGWQMGATSKWQYGWMIHLIPVSLLTQLITIILLIFYRHLSRIFVASIAGFYILNLAMSLQQGSRGGFLMVLSSFLYISLFLFGNVRIPKRGIGIVLLIGTFLAPASWIVGSAIRSGSFLENNSTLQVFTSIARRLGQSADNYIIITNDWGDKKLIEEVTSTGDGLMRAINGVVPGDAFDVEILPPGAMFKTVYWGLEVSDVHGDIWTGFGWYYASFGLIGSLFAVCLTAAFFTWCLRASLSARSMMVQLSGLFLLLWIGNDFFLNGYTEILLSTYITSLINAGLTIGAFSFMALSSRVSRRHS